jgi:hypothetical protein
MAGLVVPGVDLEVVQEAPAVLGRVEEMNPGRALVRARGSSRSRTTRIVFSSGARY